MATLRVTEIVGSPEECAELHAKIFSPSRGAAGSSVDSGEGVPASPQVTVEEAGYFFTRRPLSRNQKAIFVAIANAGGAGIKHRDLLVQTKLDASSEAGVMGALGRRAANSFNHKAVNLYGGILRWEERDGEGTYWMQPNALEALRNLKIV